MAALEISTGRIILRRDFETTKSEYEPLAYRGDAARSLFHLTRQEMSGEVEITQNRMENLSSAGGAIDLLITVRNEESARRIKCAVLDYLLTHSGEFLGSLGDSDREEVKDKMPATETEQRKEPTVLKLMIGQRPVVPLRRGNEPGVTISGERQRRYRCVDPDTFEALYAKLPDKMDE